MATYPAVHGAWHGGWCYRDVAGVIEAEELSCSHDVMVDMPVELADLLDGVA